MADGVPHKVARCCWCRGPLYRLTGHYWCKTPACAEAQRAFAIGAETASGFVWVYVPLPIQVEAERQRRSGANDGRALNVLSGGAAGTAKSMSARWSMYRRALQIPHYHGLLLRQTFKQLESTHLHAMARDEAILHRLGVPVTFGATARTMLFHDTHGLIRAGHLDDPKDVDNYLSTEYDDIVPDEASRFQPEPLLALSSRARSSNEAVMALGGPWFRPMTNPGGPAARLLVDLFIDKTPNLEALPEAAAAYDPDLWRFVPSTLDDNPYIPEGYAAQLALSHLDNPVRYRQLRHGDWRVIEGQFFSAWRETKDGRAWHVAEWRGNRQTVEWGRSLDWGRTAPGCCSWWLLLPDGRLHVLSEYKFVDTDVPDVARQIRSQDQALGLSMAHFRYAVADRAIFGTLQDRGESIAEQFRRAGVPFRPSDSARQIGWERLRSWLRDGGDGPMLTIDPSCRYARRTIPLAQSDPHDPEDIDTRKTDDHWLDQARYFVMSRPAPFGDVRPSYRKDQLGYAIDQLREDARLGVF